MFDFWYELPFLLRIGLGLLLIGISTLIFFAADRIWPYGWIAGAIMVLGSGAGGNKNGYNF
jgi:fucose permease